MKWKNHFTVPIRFFGRKSHLPDTGSHYYQWVMVESAGTQNWRETARRARVLLAEPVAHGQKLARLAEVASALGVSRGTLDNYLAALAAEEALEAQAPDIARRLDGQSAAAVSTLGRWANYDPAGLRRFFDDSPKPRLRQVLEAERVARQSHGRMSVSSFDDLIEKGRATPPWEGDGVYWYRAADEIAEALKSIGPDTMRLLDFDWAAAVPDYAGAVGLTRLARLYEQDKRHAAILEGGLASRPAEVDVPVVGLIEVPVREREEQYRREARALWLRMVAAATLVPVVIVLFPDPAAREASAENFPSPPEFWIRNGQDEPHPWLRPLNGWGGVALLTAVETLFSDWAGIDYVSQRIPGK